MQTLKEEKAALEAQELYKSVDDVSRYDIIFTINYGHEITQLKIATWYTATEAMRCFATLSEKIIQLVKTGGPISMSLVTMTEKRTPLYYGITGIVAIEHNIPQMEIVDED